MQLEGAIGCCHDILLVGHDDRSSGLVRAACLIYEGRSIPALRGGVPGGGGATMEREGICKALFTVRERQQDDRL
jgi:hypothetical protein